ncbi:MAG TPA: hypothetical protein VHO29_15510 [Marmoricola sp.]|nr:hypothetical protein [Marmoricola sp.]
MNTTRHVSAGHLVFGLIFLGITAIWVVGETSDLEAPVLAIWGPVVLIAAGAVGLAATLFNARQARAVPATRLDDPAPETTTVEDLPDATHDDTEDTDTRVLDPEEK